MPTPTPSPSLSPSLKLCPNPNFNPSQTQNTKTAGNSINLFSRVPPQDKKIRRAGPLRLSFLPSVRRHSPQSKLGLEFLVATRNILDRSIPARKQVFLLARGHKNTKPPFQRFCIFVPSAGIEPTSKP